MSKLQLLAFGVAGITFVVWVTINFGLDVGSPSSFLWAAIISFAIGFGSLMFEYARAVAAEDAEHG